MVVWSGTFRVAMHLLVSYNINAREFRDVLMFSPNALAKQSRLLLRHFKQRSAERLVVPMMVKSGTNGGEE